MRYQTCPHCHTSIPVDCFEYARDGELTYRICPECDHTTVWMMIVESEADHVPPDVLPVRPDEEVVK